jgi:hypothetical protein
MAYVMLHRMLGALDKMDTVLGVFYEPPLAEGQTREEDPQQVRPRCTSLMETKFRGVH